MSHHESKEENAAGIPASEALDLAELAAYGDGAVVSRTLSDTPVGTLTMFAFDKGQGLSEHSTPYDAFVQVLDGEGEFEIGGKTIRAGRGQLLLMPADVPHAVRAPERFKMLLTMFRSETS